MEYPSDRIRAIVLVEKGCSKSFPFVEIVLVGDTHLPDISPGIFNSER